MSDDRESFFTSRYKAYHPDKEGFKIVTLSAKAKKRYEERRFERTTLSEWNQ